MLIMLQTNILPLPSCVVMSLGKHIYTFFYIEQKERDQKDET